jgi:hypothetical protein
MARWMIQVSAKIASLITLLREEMLKSHYLHMDESVVQVLKEDGKKAEPNSYLWVQATSGKNPIILFHYAKNEWDYLINCFTNGEDKIDNNYIESHISPFTIGRKNWMFSVKPEGAVASANIYSLVETVKENGLDPFDYLKMVCTKLPLAKTEQDFLDLLPVKI